MTAERAGALRLEAADREAATSPAVASARRVITAEADALRVLAHQVGSAFAEVVDRLAAVGGRVVVTGMGKSGHVARKIAATLASTGTPALFVHPAEASHGDLGMITPRRGRGALQLGRDARAAPTSSPIPAASASRWSRIAGRARSTLVEAADLALVLPEVREACPMGLAPTTSTTCMLALGDALAVALLERRGFSASDFALFHPGGKLGSQLLRVEQLMQRGTSCRSWAPTPDGRGGPQMSDKRLGCVGVVEGGRLVGIVTDGDLRRHMAPDLFERPVRELMTPRPRTIGRRALAVEALAVMNGGGRPVTVLFVVEDGRPVGALHLHDCLKAGIV